MKKIRLTAIFMALVMLVCSCGKSEDKTADTTAPVAEAPAETEALSTTVSIADMEGYYKLQGRRVYNDAGALGLLSTADAFEFNAYCGGSVTITLLGERTVLAEDARENPSDYTGADCYFTVYIDGVRSETRFNVKEGRTELIIAEGLTQGEHSFKLVRQSEWEHGKVYVEAVTIDGEISPAPAEKELYIEFIGDSIATGFGNLPEIEYTSDWGGHPIWQDGTQAFAYMTAEALDADYSIAAIEGIGAACGYWDFTMNDIYKSYPSLSTDEYTYTPERTADIVVIELLSNDSATWREAGLSSPDEFLAKGIELAQMAREMHPDSKIIFSPGAFFDRFEEQYNEALGGEENGYYIVDLPMDTEGKSGHPTVAGQTSAAEALVQFIEENVL